MRTYFLAVAALIALSLRVLAAPVELRPIGDLRRSALRLTVGEHIHCTAFALQPPLFVTAAHCVTDAQAPITLRDASGREWAATVSNFRQDLDVATLQSEVPAAALALGADPIEDDSVALMSAVGGDLLFSLRGRMAGVNGPYVVLQLPHQGPGGSGAPLLCGADYAVCGIALGALEVSNLVVALPVSRWRSLVE